MWLHMKPVLGGKYRYCLPDDGSSGVKALRKVSFRRQWPVRGEGAVGDFLLQTSYDRFDER